MVTPNTPIKYRRARVNVSMVGRQTDDSCAIGSRVESRPHRGEYMCLYVYRRYLKSNVAVSLPFCMTVFTSVRVPLCPRVSLLVYNEFVLYCECSFRVCLSVGVCAQAIN